jgi:5S rRNA maturation endonuclease (ribonuclease M5)
VSDLADERPTVELVKSMVSCFDVLDLLDVAVNGQNKIHSPYNECDMTPSCQIHEDHFHCFSTGKGGDVLDLYMALTGCNLQQAIWRLWKGGAGAGFEPGDVERNVRPLVVPDFSDELDVARDIGWTSFHDMAMPRGVNIHRLLNNDYVLAGDGCILIPHWNEDKSACHGVKVRWFDGHKTSWPGSAFTHSLYRARTGLNTAIAWVVEGESDAWALTDVLRRLGRAEDVYALPSGAGAWKDHWLTTLDKYAAVALVLDNDRAGRDARSKIEKKIDSVERYNAHGTFHSIEVPSLMNDVREATLAGWEPPAILRKVS